MSLIYWFILSRPDDVLQLDVEHERLVDHAPVLQHEPQRPFTGKG